VLSPLMVSAAAETAVCSYMLKLGAHVLMTGDGGDEMFGSSSLPIPGLSDLLACGHLRELHREIRRWSPAIRQPYTNLVWQSLECAFRRPRTLWPGRQCPAWIHPRLSERAVAIRDACEHWLGGSRSPSQWNHTLSFYRGARVISRGIRQDFDSRQLTFPCLHRPLVEFLYAVPFQQKIRLGENRSLQRRALQGILPLKVIRRRGKGQPTESHLRRLRHGLSLWESLLSESVAQDYGFIDATKVAQALRHSSNGALAVSVPMSALVLEVWLRTHKPRQKMQDDRQLAAVRTADSAC